MPKVRKEIPELEKLVQVGRKKFVRYEEGAQLYSMGLHTFQELAKDAKAVYHVKRVDSPVYFKPERGESGKTEKRRGNTKKGCDSIEK